MSLLIFMNPLNRPELVPAEAEDPFLVAQEPGYYFWKDQETYDLQYWITLSAMFDKAQRSDVHEAELKNHLKAANNNNKVDKHKNYFLTINNYSTADFVKLVNWKFLSWAIFGFEVGPECGTPHFHVAFGTKNQVHIGTLKRMFPGREVQPIKNTHIVIAYCIKDGHVFIRGTLPTAPKVRAEKGGDATKRKWDAIAAHARSGDLDAICDLDAHAYLTCYNNLKKIRNDNRPIPDDLPESREDATALVTRGCGIWIWGPPGTGKSRSVRNDYGDRICNKPLDSRWMPSSYDPDKHDVILLEDFDIRHKAFASILKIWSDRYAFTCEIKGDMFTVRPNWIIVTSNYHPRDIWFEDRDIEPIMDRFRVVHHKVYYGKHVNSIMNQPREGDEQVHGWHKDDPHFRTAPEVPDPVPWIPDTSAENEDALWDLEEFETPTQIVRATSQPIAIPEAPINHRVISRVGFFNPPQPRNKCQFCDEELTPIGYDQEIHFCDPLKRFPLDFLDK